MKLKLELELELEPCEQTGTLTIELFNTSYVVDKTGTTYNEDGKEVTDYITLVTIRTELRKHLNSSFSILEEMVPK